MAAPFIYGQATASTDRLETEYLDSYVEVPLGWAED
jgi:hypothetical protein